MATKGETSFTQGESEVLKRIVSDWLQEEIVMPPFEAEILAVMEKLGIETPQTAAAQGSEQADRPAPGPTSLA